MEETRWGKSPLCYISISFVVRDGRRHVVQKHETGGFVRIRERTLRVLRQTRLARPVKMKRQVWFSALSWAKTISPICGRSITRSRKKQQCSLCGFKTVISGRPPVRVDLFCFTFCLRADLRVIPQAADGDKHMSDHALMIRGSQLFGALLLCVIFIYTVQRLHM